MDIEEALQALLNEYRQVEGEIDAMEEERQALRERLQELMTAAGQSNAEVKLDDQTIFLSLEQRVEIIYNEDLLRERLGERYGLILDPDARKLRHCLPQAREALLPLLDRIGSPSRHRIRKAIESGAIAPDEFKGAFEKTRKTILYVKKRPPPRFPE